MYQREFSACLPRETESPGQVHGWGRHVDYDQYMWVSWELDSFSIGKSDLKRFIPYRLRFKTLRLTFGWEDDVEGAGLEPQPTYGYILTPYAQVFPQLEGGLRRLRGGLMPRMAAIELDGIGGMSGWISGGRRGGGLIRIRLSRLAVRPVGDRGDLIVVYIP